MDNNDIVGREVWQVYYNNTDYQDCNYIYSSREKAEQQVKDDFERCSDIWDNICLVSKNENHTRWEFIPRCTGEKVMVTVFKDEIF